MDIKKPTPIVCPQCGARIKPTDFGTALYKDWKADTPRSIREVLIGICPTPEKHGENNGSL